MTTPLRIIFAGTPDFAARHLSALINSDHNIVAVYTQPDRPAGRGKKLTASAVKNLALEHSLPVFQPASLRHEDAQITLTQHNADLMVVVAYGLLLPKIVLETPRLGCINVHGSILPKWRGAAPIQRAIWAGDNETGVTIMQMDQGLDTGDILHIARVPIAANDTSESMYTKLAAIGPEALLETLDKLSSITPLQQDETLATYAKKLSKEEAQIDWSLSSAQLERNVRAFNPWPIAWFSAEDKNIKVWQAHCADNTSNHNELPGTVIKADKSGIYVATGQGTLVLTLLQLPGKKPLPATDLINARKHWFEVGQHIGGNS